MAASYDVIIHDTSDASGFNFSVVPVKIINQCAEDSGISHLTADESSFYIAALKIGTELGLEELFNF